MKETTKSRLRNFVVKTQDIMTHLSSEPTTQQETPIATSVPSPSSLPPQQKKAEHPAEPQEKKSKKRRIPFIALALVLLFANLCVLCLVGKQPLAWATSLSSSATLHHSAFTSSQDAATPASDCLTTDCYGDPATPKVLGVYQFALDKDCKTNYLTAKGDPLCWNDNDFEWAARDITCIQNTHLTDQQDNFNLALNVNFGPTTATTSASDYTAQGAPTPANTSSSPPPPSSASGPGNYNQNTCMENSICYSDDRTGTDGATIHDQSGGDDMICFNKACLGQGGTSTNANCTGLAYDRFACSPITGTSSWYYNPTAYYPSGAVEHANANLNVTGNADASGDAPNCGDNGQWQCQNGDSIFLAMVNGDNGGNLFSPFTGSPEEIAAQASTTSYIGDHPAQSRNISNNKATTNTYPPEYGVGCKANGTNWIFPCSDLANNGGLNEPLLKNDWLSGDIGAGGSELHPAHISVTYADETHSQTHLVSLSSLTQALGYVLVAPALILIGYQLLWSSWTFRRVATMEMLARLLLSVVAVGVSYELTTMLIGLSNMVSQAVVTLHATLGYPDIKLNGNNLTYTLNGEQGDPSSFRGIVVPISRWGCTMNDFMEILEDKFFTQMLGFVPFIGGMASLGKGIHDAVKAFKDMGEFVELLLSINFCIQVFVRVALVNYYILTAPIVFGCWGLPGATGQRVVSQWFKGFCSILFTQGIQLFVLTTMPLLLPAIPQLPTDTLGILYTLLSQLPRIVVLMAAIKVPALLGTGATKAISSAGTVGSGAVAAIAGAAYSVA